MIAGTGSSLINISAQDKAQDPDGTAGGSAAPPRFFMGRAMVANASTFVLLFALGRMANNVNVALLGDVTPREK